MAVPAHIAILARLTRWQLVDWVMAGATESVSMGKTVRKVAPSVLVLLGRPPFGMSADLAEGLIEGAYQYTRLLVNQLTNNWNQGYQQIMSLAEGGRQLDKSKKMELAAQEALKRLIEI